MEKSTPLQYGIYLSDEQRARFTEIVRNGHSSAKTIQHAQILLWSDRNQEEGREPRGEIAKRLGIHVNTVDRIRKQFVSSGEGTALNRKVRQVPPRAPKLDGRGEAFLVATCCSNPPEGRVRWTLQLLADELVKRKIVTHISLETVNKTLKKTNCSLGGWKGGASRKKTAPASSAKWKKSSTNTPNRLRKTSR